MHDVLRTLGRQQFPGWSRYGLTIALLVAATSLRLVAPLDTAPFLLYLPIIFLCSLAFGWAPGVIAVFLSDLFASFFFLHDGHRTSLTTGQWIAVVQFILVTMVMVAICDVLRRVIIENERIMLDLERNQASLEEAKTEAEAARAIAEAANQAKSGFLANMSHELRTPLSAVIGYTEMLEEEAQDLELHAQLADLGKIKSNARHLLSLINDVLDLSKVEANRMELFLEEADPHAFVADVVDTTESLVHRGGNTLALELDPSLGTMRTDLVKLRQCLFNLISNAGKFTENGRITLGLRRQSRPDGDWLVFSVRDTGIGMTGEQVGRLFQRFSQADETTTRRFGGTGLGLALSRAFAQLLGGDITVESVPDQGSCFTLSVPASLEGPQAQAQAQHERVRPPGDGTRRLVLVIDDERSQRDLMTRFLDRQGFEAQTAADGSVGLAMARKLQPYVILLDVMMPGMDGWSVLKALKDDPLTARIPVVMVSFVAERGLSASLGAIDTVPKPVDWARLKGTIDRIPASQSGTVLVVDDDAPTRDRLRGALEKEGWIVDEASDGAQALDRVRQRRPGLILLDLTMPVMDGFVFLHRLKAEPSHADIPVVVLSARDISRSERDELAEADMVLKKGETSLQKLRSEIRQLHR